MKDLILIFLAAFVWFQVGQSCAANADEPKFKIAIIDTGYDASLSPHKLKLCKTGHYDFKTNTHTVGHTVTHGTAVASIIAERLKNVDYCAIIFQAFGKGDRAAVANNVRALAMADKLKVDAVNYSWAGPSTSVAEREALKLLVRHGVGVFVAAGNDSKNLDRECDVFPACFDIPGMNVVGAYDYVNREILPISNRGKKVTQWQSGESVLGWTNATSFASPRALSDYVVSLADQSKPTNIKLPSEKRLTLTTNTQTSTITSEN